jgi:hypothetical protein
MEFATKAIAALGWTLLSADNGVLRFQTDRWTTVTIANGRANLPAGQEGLIDQLKVGISQQILATTAKKFGFKLTQKSPTKYSALKI